jgi:hypothetical protein
LDLAELSRRSKIERRKLRYVLDHQLVAPSFVKIKNATARRSRHFDEVAAFAIVCAARLLDLGLPHPTIRSFLEGILDIIVTVPPFSPLVMGGFPAFAELGDGSRVRVIVANFDWEWNASQGARPTNCASKPVAVVRLDIGQIWDQVAGSIVPS